MTAPRARHHARRAGGRPWLLAPVAVLAVVTAWAPRALAAPPASAPASQPSSRPTATPTSQPAAPRAAPAPPPAGRSGLQAPEERFTIREQAPPHPSGPAAGASETLLTRRALEALPGGDAQPLSYALATQPGFVADTFGFGLHVRGADGGLLYVIDGIPLLAAPLGQWGATVGFVPTRLVQSLRVMTGGFPAEYGAGLGAVVDIATRRAAGGPSGEAQVAYGSYQTTRASLNYSQEVGRLSLLVGGSFQTTSRGLDPPSVVPILHDGLLSGGGFLRLDYRVTDRDHVELIAFADQSRFQIPIDPTLLPLSQAPAGAVRGPDRYGNDPPPFVPYDANPVETERNVFVAVAYKHVDRSRALLVAPFFRESHGRLTCDAAGSLGATADPGSTCSDVGREVLHGGLVASYSWRVGARQEWKAGALLDYAHARVDYTAYFRDDAAPVGGPDPALSVTGRDLTHTLLGGLYLQDRITLGRWTLLPGARLDLERASFAGSDEPALTLVGPGGRLGVTCALTPRLTAHAFVGYLWQPPSTVDAPVAARILVPALAGQPLPVDLKAEKDWSGEVGLTAQIARGLRLGLTAWGRLATDQLDRINVGTTNLVASYNFARGRAAGAEVWGSVSLGRIVDGFANVGWQLAQGQGVNSERFLFSPDDLADKRWVMLDHVQAWTANVGLDLHDRAGRTHLTGLLNYGSGLRTGALSDQTVPAHVTVDVTLRRRFRLGRHLEPEVAVDVLNLTNEVYAYRIGTGYVGSAYGPLRRVFVRLALPFQY